MTARDLTASALAEISETEIRPALFFEGEFNSGTVRFWTGLGDVTWSGETWTGAGGLIGLSAIPEAATFAAQSVTVSLDGVDASRVSLILNEARQNMAGKVYVGFLDDAGAVIADPYTAYVGRLSEPTISDGQQGAVVSITYESGAADLTRTREFRYTPESQKLIDPSDKGFDFVGSLQEQEITWGR